MIPLRMNCLQQDFLAAICQIVSKHQVAIDVDPESVGESDLGGEMLEIMDKYELTSQDLGLLYDKLHRTGANS